MFSVIVESVSQVVNQNRRPVGQPENEMRRAGTGAGMLVTALWWGCFFALSPDVQRTASNYFHGAAPSSSAQIGFAGAFVFMVTGLLLFSTGAARSRGPRDMMVAAKAGFWIGAAAALLWNRAFVPDSPLINFVLTTLYVWTLASGGTRLFLALRGMPVPRLPNPEEMGLPVSGPASIDQAAEGMSGKRDRKRPRFRD